MYNLCPKVLVVFKLIGRIASNTQTVRSVSYFRRTSILYSHVVNVVGDSFDDALLLIIASLKCLLRLHLFRQVLNSQADQLGSVSSPLAPGEEAALAHSHV